MTTFGHHRSAALLLSATLLAMPWLPAAAEDASPVSARRPRIGLALSGGGARGAAHIGVLKVLEEQRVPVDFVAGTSMGALVGGLYATGMSAADLERVISEVDWAEAFADRIPREDRSFRRKRDDDLYLIPHKPGIRGGRLRFPPGLIDGQRIDLLLKRHTLPVVTVRDFDDLSIPYRAVAADIVTGDAIVLERGDLALALRASMAIPAIFAPREIDGRLLVDGGISENLPIDVVRRMGADVIIAVDISTPPSGREQLGSVLAISTQLATLLSEQNKRKQLATLTDRDVFIQPDLGSITTASFDRADEAVPAGVRGAEAVLALLQALSLPAEAYAVHLDARRRHVEPIPLGEVRIVNRSPLADDVIAARLGVEAGDTLDVDGLERSLDQVFGLELFESVYYDVTRGSDRNVLTVTARERAWGPDYLQAGVAAFEDFEGPDFNVAIAYSRMALNRRNAEWRTGLQVGRDPGAFTELHQPLDRGLRHFVFLRAAAGDQAVNVFDAGGHKRAELEVRHAGLELSGGRELGTWGELRAGVVREGGRISTRVGDPDTPERDFATGDAFLQLSVDRLDDSDFPRSGVSLRARFTGGMPGLGSEAAYRQGLAEGAWAMTGGRYTGYFSARVASTLEGDAPTQCQYALGGFARLSGLEHDERVGPHAGLLSAVAYRRLSDLEFLPLYAGLSAEFGNVFPSRDAVGFSAGIASGSAFLGLDTPLGPVLLAYARADGGRSNYYLSLGETFHRRRLGFWRR